jgi:hypothetical protein
LHKRVPPKGTQVFGLRHRWRRKWNISMSRMRSFEMALAHCRPIPSTGGRLAQPFELLTPASLGVPRSCVCKGGNHERMQRASFALAQLTRHGRETKSRRGAPFKPGFGLSGDVPPPEQNLQPLFSPLHPESISSPRLLVLDQPPTSSPGTRNLDCPLRAIPE